ncbi:MAG: PAS domain S-box protein [Proteobacteria bacterium]|nr:PAS domain S-box protein [Pseudomonadota bacterium]
MTLRHPEGESHADHHPACRVTSAKRVVEDQRTTDQPHPSAGATAASFRSQAITVEPDIDRFYRTLAREAPDAIIYADAEGLIRFWNKGAERIFGFSAAEALGKSLDIIIPQGLRSRHWAGYREVVRSGESRYGAGDVLAVPALRKDGTRISVEFTILPFHDKGGRTLGMAATLRDVTKRFEEMKALRSAATVKS